LRQIAHSSVSMQPGERDGPFELRPLAMAGGLLSYGASIRKVRASFVDKILTGAKPTDLTCAASGLNDCK
jgi:hypothetical protein